MSTSSEGGYSKFSFKKALVYLFLIAAALASLFPFYYMFIMATRLNREINSVPPPFTPGAHLVENFKKVTDNINFFGAMGNSFIVSATITLGVFFLFSLAGFPFSNFDFKGRQFFFGFILLRCLLRPHLGLFTHDYIIT